MNKENNIAANAPIFWFVNLDQPVRIGDRVASNTGDGKSGTLVSIGQRHFVVNWDEQGKQEFPIDLVGEIRPVL